MRKTITIKRRPNFTNLPNEIYEGSKKRIGSTFTKSGDINTGLTLSEIKKFMPHILGISEADPAFFKEYKKYFTDLTVDIPIEGLDLEVGTDKDGNPYNVLEYIKYKFAAVHPYVVMDMDDPVEKRKKRKHIFYVHDESRARLAKVAAKDARKKALTAYIKLTAKEEIMDQVIRVYGKNPELLTIDDKEMELETYAEENPEKFLQITGDKQLETRSFIHACLSAEVIRKVGNTYLNGEEILGNSMEETILYIEDKANSDTLLTLKARLKEFK